MVRYWLSGLVRLGEMTIYPIGALFGRVDKRRPRPRFRW